MLDEMTTIFNENLEVLNRVRLAPLLTGLLHSTHDQHEYQEREHKIMAKTDDLIAAVTRYQTAADAKAAADAQTITGDEATIAQDQQTLTANAATITDLQNHEVDDAVVAKFNEAAAAIEATLPPPALTTTVPTTNADGSVGANVTVPATVAVGDVIPVPTATPGTTLDHTVTAIDPATGGLTVEPVAGAAPVTADGSPATT